MTAISRALVVLAVVVTVVVGAACGGGGGPEGTNGTSDALAALEPVFFVAGDGSTVSFRIDLARHVDGKTNPATESYGSCVHVEGLTATVTGNPEGVDVESGGVDEGEGFCDDPKPLNCHCRRPSIALDVDAFTGAGAASSPDAAIDVADDTGARASFTVDDGLLLRHAVSANGATTIARGAPPLRFTADDGPEALVVGATIVNAPGNAPGFFDVVSVDTSTAFAVSAQADAPTGLLVLRTELAGVAHHISDCTGFAACTEIDSDYVENVALDVE